MTRTEKELLKVLVDLGLAEKDWVIKIRRTYAGYWQRASGAWSWWVDRLEPELGMKTEICGSVYPCKRIIDAHRKAGEYVDVYHGPGGTELFPENK